MISERTILQYIEVAEHFTEGIQKSREDLVLRVIMKDPFHIRTYHFPEYLHKRQSLGVILFYSMFIGKGDAIDDVCIDKRDELAIIVVFVIIGFPGHAVTPVIELQLCDKIIFADAEATEIIGVTERIRYINILPPRQLQ